MHAFFTVSLHRLGRECDHRKFRELRHAPDNLCRFTTIHARHHDVHENGVDRGILLKRFDCLWPALGMQNMNAMPLQYACERQYIPQIVVNYKDGPAGGHTIRQRRVQPLWTLCNP